MKQILAIFISLILSIPIHAQSAETVYNTEKGYMFPTKGSYRMLVVYVNIIYDVTPALAPNIVNNWGWTANSEEGINVNPPIQFFKDVFDTDDTLLPHEGFFTRLMSECSFDSLVMLGDFTSVSIKQSSIQPNGAGFGYLTLMNRVLGFINSSGGLQAVYGHNAIEDYDNAAYNSLNNVVRAGNNKLDYVVFLVLNPTKTHGGLDSGSGVTSAHTLTTRIKLSNGEFPIENWMLSAIGHRHIKHESGNFVHEFAHNLLGGNPFHTSGGNHLANEGMNTFIYIQKGYGLFGNILRTCNAYERWRLNWQHPANFPHRIAANGINSDLLSTFTGTQTYYLRDFVTYGDAIRIKLPYKGSEDASNQYIWLENHQLGKNNKLDGLSWHFFPNLTCTPLGNPGIYSYIQVGKDILESDDFDVVFPSNETDNLRMINAEGNYNMQYVGLTLDCMNWGNRPTFEYLTPNPISGKNDQTEAIMPPANGDFQFFSDFTHLDANKIKDGVLYNQIISSGDNFDGFESGSVMDISSNPTPINAATYYAYYQEPDSYVKADNHRDTRKKYLTGLSIAMNYAYSLPNAGDVFKVDIRWDDYDVKQDVNWAGDIVLKENLNLLANKTIYLEQNLTVYQIDRDPVSGIFAPPTKFTCESGSVFTMNPNSKVIVKEQSSLIMLNGSSLTIQDGAEIVVKAGSTFIVKQGANLTIQGSGKLSIEPGAHLCTESGANIQRISE